ncbi:MAG TPA: serine hydrolase [Chthonomonadaceae bacterium]|nr:serine hydrolase [Chthonomonadaceae bacterium]
MRLLRFIGAGLAFALLIAAGRGQAAAPAARQTARAADQATGLAAIEKSIEKQRDALHVPGAALVIVKDDKVIFIKGFGLRDVEDKLPVTPRTQFAIGSSTKAFTAMTAMMTVDDGKLSLSDPPRKYLPYFKMRDPDADAKITISDLLCHRSGLDRTDIAWYTGKLSSEETIRLVATIKPTAKLGEKFQYQNVMFLTAGQCVAVAQHTPWRTVVAKRIFQPLHMKETNTSVRDMERYTDRSFGYTYDAEKKAPVRLPYRDITALAPAGAINSNAVEMAQWLRLVLGGGVFDGKRLVSEASFAELFKKHMSAGALGDYGYGWFLHDWHGHQVAEHGGNIDGFNAQVALMPDQKLGFVLLTNVSTSPLGALAMETVWDSLVGAPKPAEGDDAAAGPPVPPAQEVGTYLLKEANMALTVAVNGDKLTLKSKSLPETPLVALRGRKYRVAIPNLDGVFATFRPDKEDPKKTELYFEQPGAAFVCKLVPAAAASVPFVSPMPAEELMGKVVDAMGGEANLKRHKSLLVKATSVVETQGIVVKSVSYRRGPNSEDSTLTLYAGKKAIGYIRSYFDGKTGASESTISGDTQFPADARDAIALSAALFPEANWRTLFKTAAITGMSKVGDEETYTVELRPEKGAPMVDYISTKSFRVLRRVLPGSAGETYSDFRMVDGVLFPFSRAGVMAGLGEATTTLTSVKLDPRIPESAFRSSRHAADSTPTGA